MTITFSTTGCQSQSSCVDPLGCPTDRCPDFTIRRHDTKPPLRVAVEDCDGPMDFRGLVVEVNMWAAAKLKADVAAADTYFQLADGVGFDQIMIGDIIVADRVRMPERMIVTGFDEKNKFVEVQRGYHGTVPSDWKKATKLRIFRILNGSAEFEMTFDTVRDVDGTTKNDVIQDSFLVYEWQPEDTCVPGCYWLEFKVLKMIDVVWYLPGGHWTGSTHQDAADYFFTGAAANDGSARLSYDQVTGYYVLPTTPWAGEVHLWTDGNYYTGTAHSDSSVLLNKLGVVLPPNFGVGSGGLLTVIWFLKQGAWAGPVCTGPGGLPYTGSSFSDASARLNFNQSTSQHFIADSEWSGAFHSLGENVYYTGSNHNDGSVVLDRTEIPFKGFTSTSGLNLADLSLVPSFTDEGLTPYYFGCILGDGVEWVRRFPVGGEGFLVKIVDSPTAEM